MNSTITTQYRVVATTTSGFVDPKIDISYPWKGTDTDELSREFPPSDIMFADPFDQKEIEDGFIITRFTFEQLIPGGKDILDETGDLVGVTADHWEEIDDPRRRLTPMTDLERAIDAENRRDFPGDYITEDECDCGQQGCPDCDPNDYSIDCVSCGDYGCVKCDPNWCAACGNNGCATCMPQHVCPSCKQWADPQYESLGKDSGLCQNCEYYAKLCVQCGHGDHDGDDKLCSSCRSDNEWEAAIKCNYCDNAVVANKGDNCQSCQVYLDALCSNCQYNDANGDDKFCADCRNMFAESDTYWRSYYVWWRRAFRACKFWR